MTGHPARSGASDWIAVVYQKPRNFKKYGTCFA